MTDVLDAVRDRQLDADLAGGTTTYDDLVGSDVDVTGGMVFETTGSSGSAKQVPYANLDHLRQTSAEAFALAGFSGDRVLNLFAPLPHPSGWILREAATALGGATANRHFEDYRSVVEDGDPADVTAVAALPTVAVALGEAVEREYDRPATLFPNLRTAFVAGEVVTDDHRRRLRERWGVEAVRELYASAETGVVASAVDGSRELVPLLHRFVLEVVPDGGDVDDAVDVRDVAAETTGSLLVTAPDREAVDLRRYRIGDVVRVHPGDDVPRIEVLGREDDSINLGGALLYPAQIHAAVEDTYGPATDWVAVASEPEYPAVDFYVVDASPRGPAFLANLLERNSAVRESYEEVGAVDYLDVHHVDGREAIPGVEPGDGTKTDHVVFDDSYGN